MSQPSAVRSTSAPRDENAHRAPARSVAPYGDDARYRRRDVDRARVVASRGQHDDTVLTRVCDRVGDLGELRLGPVSRRAAEGELDDSNIDSTHDLRLDALDDAGAIGLGAEVLAAFWEHPDRQHPELRPGADHAPAVGGRAGHHRDVGAVVVARDVVDRSAEDRFAADEDRLGVGIDVDARVDQAEHALSRRRWRLREELAVGGDRLRGDGQFRRSGRAGAAQRRRARATARASDRRPRLMAHRHPCAIATSRRRRAGPAWART